MMKVCSLLPQTATGLLASAVFATSALTACHTDEQWEVQRSELSHEKLPADTTQHDNNEPTLLTFHFAPRLQPLAAETNAERQNDTKVENLVGLGHSNPYSLNTTAANGRIVANWQAAQADLTGTHTWHFVANLASSDMPTVNAQSNLTNVELQTSRYLRGASGVSATAGLVMSGTAAGVNFSTTTARVRVHSGQVNLRRAFARFRWETFPLPKGFVITKVSLERVPGKFKLSGNFAQPYAQLNTQNASNYPYVSATLWNNPNGTITTQPMATWARYKYEANPNNADAEHYLRGTLYVPPVVPLIKAGQAAGTSGTAATDPFGTATDHGMTLLRFVFTDNMKRTFVRLYRLGNSPLDSKVGHIEANKDYEIRINLLGTAKTRADNDAVVKALDEGSNKAAFLN